MPRKDGTGPIGLGAMTGKGIGYCAIAEDKKVATGMGLGLRYSCGNGYGRRAYRTNIRPMTAEVICEQLEMQKEILQMRIKEIDKQLSEI